MYDTYVRPYIVLLYDTQETLRAPQRALYRCSSLLTNDLRQEFLAKTGYRPDALVDVNAIKFGIEVDGPYHYAGRKATGRTLLKCKQLSTLDNISVVSVPHWEWDDVGMDSRGKRQEYLRNLLCFG